MSVWYYPLKEEQSFSDQFLAGSALKLPLSQEGAKGRNRKPQGLSLLRTSRVFRRPGWFLNISPSVSSHHILRTSHISVVIVTHGGFGEPCCPFLAAAVSVTQARMLLL